MRLGFSFVRMRLGLRAVRSWATKACSASQGPLYVGQLAGEVELHLPSVGCRDPLARLRAVLELEALGLLPAVNLEVAELMIVRREARADWDPQF